MKITPVSGILGEVQVYKDLRQGRHLRFRENEWANLARTEKMTDPETGEPLEDEEIIEDTPLLINLKVSSTQKAQKKSFGCIRRLFFNFCRDVAILHLLIVMFLQILTIIFQM